MKTSTFVWDLTVLVEMGKSEKEDSSVLVEADVAAQVISSSP